MQRIISATPALRTGKLKPLAVGATKRAPTLPDVPTTAEAGLPSYEASIWWAWGTPARVPAAVLNKLNQEVGAILAMPETAMRFAAEGAVPERMTPAELRQIVKADLAKWEKVARDAKMASLGLYHSHDTLTTARLRQGTVVICDQYRIDMKGKPEIWRALRGVGLTTAISRLRLRHKKPAAH